MAAVLGGTQSLHTNSFDEALGLPTDTSSRVARNTQLIIAEESGIPRVVDPLAGSYYVESLTHRLVVEAQKLLDEVESFGGMTKAIQAGIPKMRIEESAAKRQARIDRGLEVIVGVNEYRLENEPDIEVLDIDNTAVRSEQIAALERIRASRNSAAVTVALNTLTQAASSGHGNLLALAIEAARLRATVGEISEALAASFTRYEATTMTIEGVYSAQYSNDGDFNNVVAMAQQFERDHGRRPRILIAKLGQDGHDRGAKVIATAFADMGFDVDLGPLFSTPEEAARQASDNDVHVVGVSSQAAGHKTLIPQLIAALKAEQAGNILVVAGGVIPPKDYAFLYEAGVSAIFGPGTNIVEAASNVIRTIDAHLTSKG